MKSLNCLLLYVLAFAVTVRAQTATTDPVGFITLNVASHGGTAQSKVSFVGLGMTREVVYQGIIDSTTINSVTSNLATWADNQFNKTTAPIISHFLEITSGAAAGTMYDIQTTSASTKTITLVQSLTSGIINGVTTFKVRTHWTLASVFGVNNEKGLTGGTSTSADQILLWNGTGYDTYYYKTTTGLGGTGWRSTASNSVNESGALVYQEEGVIINRRQSSATAVTLLGAVKTGQTSVPVGVGNNYLGNFYAAPMTLANCGIYTGVNSTGLAGGTTTSADQILIWNSTSNGYDTYYYKTTTGLGGTGWRSTASNSIDASPTPITVGTSIIVNRKAASGFTWVIPQHPANL